MKPDRLIKLSDIHYIIVDDSEMKGGDYRFNIHRKYYKEVDRKGVDYYNKRNDVFKKIIYSTIPLEPVVAIGFEKQKCFDKIKPLSLVEVEEMLYGYSVDKMAEEEYLKHPNNDILYGEDEYLQLAYKAGVVDGFKAHKELTKDKLHEILSDFYFFVTNGEVCKHEIINEFLLPSTEWEVRFNEQGKLELI